MLTGRESAEAREGTRFRKRAVSLAAARQGGSQSLWRWDGPRGQEEGHSEKHRFLRAPSEHGSKDVKRSKAGHKEPWTWSPGRTLMSG